MMEEELVELVSRQAAASDVPDVDGRGGGEAPLATREEKLERRGRQRLVILLACMVPIAGMVGYFIAGDVILNGSNLVENSPCVDNDDPAFSLHANATDYSDTSHEAPKRIFLIGERNSGTNYVEGILSNAFYPRYSATGSTHGRALYNFAGCTPDARPVQVKTCSPIFKFKHMFRHSPLSAEELQSLRERNDVLWILVVRSPCEWADAMWRKPWHLCSPSDPPSKCKGGYIGVNSEALKNVSRASFFSDLPWWENPEAREGGDFVYPEGVFDLRKHKLGLMLQLLSAVGPHRVKLAHLKQIELSPERFVQNVAREFGLEANKWRKELRPSTKAHKTLCLTDDEWQAAREKIDWKMEGKFGFTALDCHTCVKR